MTAALREAAESWLMDNPEAASLFLQYARELASRGRRFGVKLIAERARYEMALSGTPLKVNNNVTAYVGRWLVSQDPFLAGFISFRRTRG